MGCSWLLWEHRVGFEGPRPLSSQPAAGFLSGSAASATMMDGVSEPTKGANLFSQVLLWVSGHQPTVILRQRFTHSNVPLLCPRHCHFLSGASACNTVPPSSCRSLAPDSRRIPWLHGPLLFHVLDISYAQNHVVCDLLGPDAFVSHWPFIWYHSVCPYSIPFLG